MHKPTADVSKIATAASTQKLTQSEFEEMRKRVLKTYVFGGMYGGPLTGVPADIQRCNDATAVLRHLSEGEVDAVSIRRAAHPFWLRTRVGAEELRAATGRSPTHLPWVPVGLHRGLGATCTHEGQTVTHLTFARNYLSDCVERTVEPRLNAQAEDMRPSRVQDVDWYAEHVSAVKTSAFHGAPVCVRCLIGALHSNILAWGMQIRTDEVCLLLTECQLRRGRVWTTSDHAYNACCAVWATLY